MKNYILTLLFALVAFTSCNTDEYYYKTPGEITGEKIIELVENGHMSQCIVDKHFNDVRNFKVDGQFLHVMSDNNTLTFDLNHLKVWKYVRMNNVPESYFSFYFY